MDRYRQRTTATTTSNPRPALCGVDRAVAGDDPVGVSRCTISRRVCGENRARFTNGRTAGHEDLRRRCGLDTSTAREVLLIDQLAARRVANVPGQYS